MQTAKKIVLNKQSKVVRLYDNFLRNYLNNYDISRNEFNYDISSEQDIMILSRYYDDSLQKANMLVTEEEFVGITYENLDIIKNKLVMKR